MAKSEDRKASEISSAAPDMVHLCVSISDDGVRLESVQKRSPKTAPRRGQKAVGMATLRRQPRSRSSSTRQDRGSCSSTASCPVFSGSYSDQEEPPLRGQSSPLLKGSFTSLNNCTKSAPKLSAPSYQGSLPSLRGSTSFKDIPSNLAGSLSPMKRGSLGSLDRPSTRLGEWSTSHSLQSSNCSSSDDGSWDTNSWSSVATCLQRTPVKHKSAEVPGDSSVETCTAAQTAALSEPETIYQNLNFANSASQVKSKACLPAKTSKALRKDSGASHSSDATTCSQGHEKTEDRRKFSQFLNEVTHRVLRSNSGTTQQKSTLRKHLPSPPLPSTSSRPPSTSTPRSALTKSPPSESTPNLWSSPTSSNLRTIKEFDSRDITTSIRQWSQTLPSCKVLEPGEMLRMVKGGGHLHNLERCTKVQALPSTGRLYLETDIDRLRQLDEMVANGTLGKERKVKVLEKAVQRGKDWESKIPCGESGDLGAETRKEMEKKRESSWERKSESKNIKEKGKQTDKSGWEKDGRTERGREKEKKAIHASYQHPPPSAPGGQNSSCPVFSWSEEFSRMSFRSTSLPRPVTVPVSRAINY